MNDPLGDSLGASGSDIVRLGATTDAATITFGLELAGLDNPTLLYYEVAFTVGATTYYAFAILETDDTFSAAKVTTDFVSYQDASASFLGSELLLVVERADIGSPLAGDTISAISARTSFGKSGIPYDATGTGSYVVGQTASPAFGLLPDVVVLENSTISFTVSATDGDGDSVTITPDLSEIGSTALLGDVYDADNAGDNATFNATSGAFSWPVDFFDAGFYNISFTADDGASLPTVETVMIQVINVNRAPDFTADPYSFLIAQGASLAGDVDASDLDLEVLTYGSPNAPAGFSIDSATGALAWTTPPRGLFSFSLNVTDGIDTTVAAISIRVGNPPVLADLDDQLLNETESLSLDLASTDLDGEPMTFSARWVTNNPDPANITMPAGMTVSTLTNDEDGATGAISWTPDHTQAGLYFIQVRTTDGFFLDTETIQISVGNTNRLPGLAPIAGVTVNETELVSIQLVETDPDEDDTMTFSLDNPPATGVSGIDGSAIFNWTTTNRSAGVYSFVFNVTDGYNWSTATALVTVVDLDVPTLDPVAGAILFEGTTITRQLVGADSTNDPLTYSLVGAAPAGASVDPNTGLFTFAAGCTEAGIYTITFGVSDGYNLVTQSATFQVLNENCAPVFPSVLKQWGREGFTLSFGTAASDPEGDALTITASGLPWGASYDSGTQTFTWYPLLNQSGAYTVGFSAYDGAETTSISVDLNVNNTARSLMLISAVTGTASTSPGVSANLVFRVQNLGWANEKGTLTFVKPTGWSLSASPSSFDVLPNSSQLITVTVTPTASPLQGTIQIRGDSLLGAFGISSGTIKIPIVPTLTLNDAQVELDQAVSGSVTLAFLNGVPAANYAIRILEQYEPGGFEVGAARQKTITTNGAGYAAFDLAVSASGANAPGDHLVTAQVVLQGTARVSAGYLVMPGAAGSASVTVTGENDGTTPVYVVDYGTETVALSFDAGSGTVNEDDGLDQYEALRALAAGLGYAADGMSGGEFTPEFAASLVLGSYSCEVSQGGPGACNIP